MFKLPHIFNLKSLSTNILKSSNYYNIKVKHNIELKKDKIINITNDEIKNKSIKKFILPVSKIEMHESHSCKPFIIKNSNKYY